MNNKLKFNPPMGGLDQSLNLQKTLSRLLEQCVWIVVLVGCYGMRMLQTNKHRKW